MENAITQGIGRPSPKRSRALAPKEEPRGIVGWAAGKYNKLRRTMRRSAVTATACAELNRVRELAAIPSDIDEHLELMFMETLLLQPRTIVELGVRGGVSTFVFEQASKLCQASIVSVDIDDCSSNRALERWHFVQEDDVTFAESFKSFCGTRGLEPGIDLLFIDTSHYYTHTVDEIEAWFPLLALRSKVIFHDTNLKRVGRRRDGCFQLSWDNGRGVIHAIEKYLGIPLNENHNFITVANGWLVRHWPNCNGLTILDRLESTAVDPSR